MTYLVTGAAGFIGYHLCLNLLQQGHKVVGIDNFNDYYQVSLKHDRISQLQEFSDFSCHTVDISNQQQLTSIFENFEFNTVFHLAAQAGVRYSIDNPEVYGQSNLVGHLNVLEACRQFGITHLVYASSSSVYGNNQEQPFSVTHNTDKPISLYAATKKANELMSHSYSHLYNFAVTGLRFFTVYGPWGRPDMAPFKFAKRIFAGEPIDLYNHGNLSRDFTYIDDIVEAMILISQRDTSEQPAEVYNIGNGQPVNLAEFVAALEAAIGKKAIINNMPMQPGDVYTTWADTRRLEQQIQRVPKVNIRQGISQFIDWYKDYYKDEI